MLSIPSILAGVLALASVVHSAPASLDAEPNSVSGYAMVPISWNLPVKLDDPTGATVTVTGTIEEAIAQMEASYPGWNATFQAQLPPIPADDGDGASLVSTAGLEDPAKYDCNVDYKKATTLTIVWGINYLRGVPGTAKNGPGPNNCGRVSCSWNSAIYWCNDNDDDKELQWNDIADAASATKNKCKYNRGHDVKGRGSMKENWNVLIRGDDC
ncbi:hypothetical protein QBC40DRAFT_181512 [Triangularia verruculosa]|uniref:Uncharacterized protein n=1 Tax=Triangularia verruculosa TaxID=2587418 RepID=A0AAN6XAY3_9PEZI|nr:hypothetical protein QBC40DRAFT_181512 [Triangularia verruculosa]